MVFSLKKERNGFYFKSKYFGLLDGNKKRKVKNKILAFPLVSVPFSPEVFKMNFIFSNIKWIMFGSGIITFSMILSTLHPTLGLTLTFGDTLNGDLANIIVRNWGALIALTGGMLVYGAYNEPNRNLILFVSSISKTTFVLLNLIYGQSYLTKSGIALVFDSVFVIIFVSYLLKQNSKK